MFTRAYGNYVTVIVFWQDMSPKINLETVGNSLILDRNATEGMLSFEIQRILRFLECFWTQSTQSGVKMAQVQLDCFELSVTLMAWLTLILLLYY
jgi:hypothetical protein